LQNEKADYCVYFARENSPQDKETKETSAKYQLTLNNEFEDESFTEKDLNLS
jgi:hypothetical protein